MNNDTNSEYHMNEAHWIDICGRSLFGQHLCFRLNVKKAVSSIFPNNPLQYIVVDLILLLLMILLLLLLLLALLGESGSLEFASGFCSYSNLKLEPISYQVHFDNNTHCIAPNCSLQILVYQKHDSVKHHNARSLS